jgi:hypothetical protein
MSENSTDSKAPETPQFHCPTCSMTFNNYSALIVHVQTKGH